MKNLVIAFFLAVSIESAAQNKKLLPAQPIIQSRDCILKIVATKMNVTLDPKIALPRIRTQTDTSLKDFQDSIEGFWHFRPEVFTNVYNPLRNEVFIMTERDYYQSKKRSVFDSVAHELVHYVQKEYKGYDFSQADDSAEMDAVEVQTWFRETYRKNFKNGKFICPN